ncbi:MAG: hypothetical protein M5R36_11235 [Deltaproteobacteria bacterium]|nr:hypothetical protein [Deltaproteobacteria bacterium]
MNDILMKDGGVGPGTAPPETIEPRGVASPFRVPAAGKRMNFKVGVSRLTHYSYRELANIQNPLPPLVVARRRRRKVRRRVGGSRTRGVPGGYVAAGAGRNASRNRGSFAAVENRREVRVCVCLKCVGTFWGNNNGASCGDGTFCNGADTCNGGTCSVHAGDPCSDDGNPCTGIEFCDEGQDQCRHSGNPCSDGEFCNGEEICTPIDTFFFCDDGVEPCEVEQTCVEGRRRMHRRLHDDNDNVTDHDDNHDFDDNPNHDHHKLINNDVVQHNDRAARDYDDNNNVVPRRPRRPQPPLCRQRRLQPSARRRRQPRNQQPPQPKRRQQRAQQARQHR